MCILIRSARRIVGFILGLSLIVCIFMVISSYNKYEQEISIVYSHLQVRLFEFVAITFLVWVSLSSVSLYSAIRGITSSMLVNVFGIISWLVCVVVAVPLYLSGMQTSFEIALPLSLQSFVALAAIFGIPMFNVFQIKHSMK